MRTWVKLGKPWGLNIPLCQWSQVPWKARWGGCVTARWGGGACSRAPCWGCSGCHPGVPVLSTPSIPASSLKVASCWCAVGWRRQPANSQATSSGLWKHERIREIRRQCRKKCSISPTKRRFSASAWALHWDHLGSSAQVIIPEGPVTSTGGL